MHDSSTVDRKNLLFMVEPSAENTFWAKIVFS